MAGSIPKHNRTRKADVDLSGKQFCIAKDTANNGCTFAAAATDEPAGVIYQKPRATVGTAVCITTGGTTKVRSGAAFAVGAVLTSDAQGRAIPAVPAAAGAVPTTRLIGKAMQAAAGADEIVEISLDQMGTRV